MALPEIHVRVVLRCECMVVMAWLVVGAVLRHVDTVMPLVSWFSCSLRATSTDRQIPLDQLIT